LVPLWILALVALAFFLRSTRELFVPIVLSLLIAYALAPIVAWLEERRVPRVAGSALVLAVLFGAAGWGAWTLRDDFRSAAERLPSQVRQLRSRFEAAAGNGTTERLRQALTEMQEMTAADQQQSRDPVEGVPGAAPRPAQGLQGGGNAGAASTPLAQYLWQGSSGLIAVAGYVTVVVFLVFFLLVGAPSWRRRLVEFAGDVLESRGAGAEVLDEITWQIQRFLIVRLITAVIVGFATWGALVTFGAPAAGLWAVVAGVLNSVPFFGPLMVSTGLGMVGLFDGGLTMALKLAGAALVITSLEGWLLTPVLLGRAARMNTLAVFVGLLVWSWAWGVWGTLLAVPMLSIVKAVCDHVKALNPVSKLLEA
jgi:predicted PurR-regulated permease PerM